MTARPLTDHQRDLLRDLEDDRWMTPQWVGGRNGLHHSATLAQLARRGLAERRKLCDCGPGSWRERELLAKGITPKWPWCRCKGSCRYRRTPAGRAVLEMLLQPSQ